MASASGRRPGAPRLCSRERRGNPHQAARPPSNIHVSLSATARVCGTAPWTQRRNSLPSTHEIGRPGAPSQKLEYKRWTPAASSPTQPVARVMEPYPLPTSHKGCDHDSAARPLLWQSPACTKCKAGTGGGQQHARLPQLAIHHCSTDCMDPKPSPPQKTRRRRTWCKAGA